MNNNPDECHICCEKHLFNARYGCKHEICYKCATRLVYLYNDKRCPMCKYEKDRPIFYKTTDSNNNSCNINDCDNSCNINDCSSKIELEGLTISQNINNNVNINNNSDEAVTKINNNSDEAVTKINNNSDEAITKIKNLLLIKCKICKQSFKTKKDLMFHFKQHSSLLCITCLENNHQFWYEYSSYSPETLSLHRKGLLKEAGFEGHLFCPFCSIWLYNKETARKHCNQEHQICTVCDSMGIKFQFYRNFTELESHYRSRHYCCDNPACIQSYCYVYAYKSELCAHLVAQHGIERQLDDVKMSNEKNPVVFSLHESGMEESSVGVDFTRPILTTTFPSFNTNSSNNNNNSSNLLPGFLDRAIIHQTNTLTSQRLEILKGLTPFYNEISIIIGKYIDSLKSLSEMVSEIEECVGKDLCYKILLKISFLQKQKEIEQFSKEYKKELKFPIFKKETKKVEESGNKKGIGFRIIDFTKK